MSSADITPVTISTGGVVVALPFPYGVVFVGSQLKRGRITETGHSCEASHVADGSDILAMKMLLQPTSFFFDGLSQGIELVRNVPMKHRSLSLAYFAGTVLSTVDFPRA